MHQPLWVRLIQWLVVLVLPVFLVAADLRAVTNHWIVHWEYDKPGFPADQYGLSKAEREYLALVSVDYIRTDAGISLLANLELPDGSPAFNDRELEHMVDVQRVFHQIQRAGSIAGGILLTGAIILLALESSGRLLLAALVNGSLLTLGVLIAIGAFMALSWNDFFTLLHRLFFEGDSWLFAYSDTLIRLFPIRFWMDITAVVVGGLVASTIVFGFAARTIDHRPVRQNPPPTSPI
jgi:integral membrane protein (TIGR01906 family)